MTDFPRRIRREARGAEHVIPPLRNGDTLSLTLNADDQATAASITRDDSEWPVHIKVKLVEL